MVAILPFVDSHIDGNYLFAIQPSLCQDLFIFIDNSTTDRRLQIYDCGNGFSRRFEVILFGSNPRMSLLRKRNAYDVLWLLFIIFTLFQI
jgi:hypothetical protein